MFIIKTTILSLFLLLSLSYGQDNAILQTNMNYYDFSSSPLENGLPALEVGKPLNLNIKDASFAWINPAGYLSSLYFIAGKDKKNIHKYWLLANYGIKGLKLKAIEFEKVNLGVLKSIEMIESSGGNNHMVPIEIVYEPHSSVLYYKWITSSASSNPYISNPIVVVTPNIKLGKMFPNIQFETLTGNKYDLNQFKGKVIVFNWVSQEPLSMDEVSRLNYLADKYSTNSDVIFFAVVNDFQNFNNSLNENQFKFNQIVPGDSFTKLFGKDSSRSIIIDRQGVVIYDKKGGKTDEYKEIDKEVKNALSSK